MDFEGTHFLFEVGAAFAFNYGKFPCALSAFSFLPRP